MDINSPLTPPQQPNNSGVIPPAPRPFVAAAPTPPPMRNPMVAPATPAPVVPQPVTVPVAPAAAAPAAVPVPAVPPPTPQPVPQQVAQPAPQPIVQMPSPLAMPEPMVQMSAPAAPTPVVAPATPIPTAPPFRVPEPAAGQVFTAPNVPYVEPPLTPLSSIRNVPPAGGMIVVAPVAHKSHWLRALMVVVVVVVGAAAAYVFGYDRNVLLGSKDLLAKSFVANTETTQGSGQMEMKVTVTSEVASNPMPVGEAIYETPTVGKTEPITFDFSMNADFGFTNKEGIIESFVKFDPLTISIKPDYLAQEQGIPSTINAAFEVRLVDEVLYAQISRLTPEVSGMIEMMTGMNVVGQWISTTSYEATTTTDIEDLEDAQRIGLRILDEAVNIESDVYKIGSREITFTLDPEKMIAVMADEEGIDDEMRKEAIEDLKDIEFKKPMQLFVVIDRRGEVTQATFTTSIAESQTDTTFDAMFSYRITDTGEVNIEAPSNAIDLDEMFAQQFVETSEQSQADSMFMSMFYEIMTDETLVTATTYSGACKKFTDEYGVVGGVWPSSVGNEFPAGYEVKDFRCFDAATKMAVSAALYKDDQVMSQLCYDVATDSFTTDFKPVADPVSVSCISTIR